MRFAALLLLVVIGVRPERIANGLAGPFNKALAQERRCSVTPMHPGFLAATLKYGRDAAIGLYLFGITIALTIVTKR